MRACCVSRGGFIAGTGALLLAGASRAGEAPVFRMGLFSDTHVNDDPQSCERVRLALETFRREKVDAIAHLGDLANYHLPKAFRNYRNTVDAVFPASSGRPRFLYAWGNHDFIDYARRDNPKDRQMDRHAAFAVMKDILFSAKAKVEVNPDKRFKWLTIRIPTVENVSDVRSYRVLAERKTDDGMEEVLRENAIGDFDEMPSARKGHVDMRIEAKPFTPGETYRFTVTPEGFFGRQGASLSCDWRANVVN